MKNLKIVVVNLAIAVGVILTIIGYVFYQQKTDREDAYQSFQTTTRVMEDVVGSDITSAQKLCESRAKYINKNKMTLTEAIAAVRNFQTSDVTGHIIRLDTMEGLSTNASRENKKDYSVSYKDLNVIDVKSLDDDSKVHLTESYTNPIDGAKVVSFYSKVTILDEKGNDVEAVLLRVTPMELLQQKWNFSEYYKTADFLLIDNDGGYVVKPKEISGIGFYDYLKPGEKKGLTVESLMKKIQNNSEGTFKRTNRYNEEHYFVYHHLSIDEDFVVVGCIPISELSADKRGWVVPALVVFTIIILSGINCIYFHRDSKKKQQTESTMKEQRGVIDLLSHEFESLWVIDDKQGTYRLFQGQISCLEEYRQANIVQSGEYSDFMYKYLRCFVAGKDRDRIKEIVFDRYFFDLIPQDGRMFVVNFEKSRRGKTQYFQMCFARPTSTLGESFVVLGLRNVDDKMKLQNYQNQLLNVAVEQAEAVNKVKELLLPKTGSEG